MYGCEIQLEFALLILKFDLALCFIAAEAL